MPDEMVLDYDPPKEKRQYYRHATTGDLAYKVWRGGKEHIRFDRPYDPTVMIFREAEWKEEPHAEPMGIGQAVQVCFEADKKLCQYLGLPVKSKADWANLSDKDRNSWVVNGPIQGPAPRKELYDAIKKVLEPFTRPK